MSLLIDNDFYVLAEHSKRLDKFRAKKTCYAQETTESSHSCFAFKTYLLLEESESYVTKPPSS